MTTMSDVERVAQAMREDFVSRYRQVKPWDQIDQPMRDTWLQHAASALQAMRPMLEDAHRAGENCAFVGDCSAATTYADMVITAAMKEGGE